MKKNYAWGISLSVLLMCVAAPGAARAEGEETPVPIETSSTLRVSLDVTKGYSAKSLLKLEQAADTMERVINSEEFRQAVLNFSYKDSSGKVIDHFADNQLNRNDDTSAENLTNAQVYEAILKGAEQLNDIPAVEDNTANFQLTLYTPPWYKKWSVLGYTYEGKPMIYVNWYYFNSNSPAGVAGNMAHEWVHKIGFGHDYNRTQKRPFSVPYAVGDLVVKLGEGTTTPRALP